MTEENTQNEGKVPIIPEEKRKEALENWEKKEFNKANEFGGYDKKEELKVKKIFFYSIIGILSVLLLIVIFLGGTIGIVIIKDGTLLSNVNATCNQDLSGDNNICGNQTLVCNQTCGNISYQYPNQTIIIKVYTNGTEV